MKLTKAIEIMELNIKEAGSKMPPDCRDALRIIIEAAKHIKALRGWGGLPSWELLPGETKE